MNQKVLEELKAMKLSKIEQETIICWHNGQKEISVTTCSKKLQKKLEQVGHFMPVYTAVFDNCCSKEYIIPREWLQVRKPPSRPGFLDMREEINGDVD